MKPPSPLHEPVDPREAVPSGRPRRSVALPVALVAGAVILLAFGIVPRLHAASALNAQTAAQTTLHVSVIQPKTAPAEQDLLLPGTVSPYASAALYARTSGYVQRWNADIGAKVKAGAVLAVLQTPEVDAQLQQARADLATATANFAFAKSTSDRWQAMLGTQSVSQQDAQARLSDMEAKRSMVASAQANVARLAEQVAYEQIRAPFDGVVTSRNVDIGTLVTAGGAPGLGANTGELFHMEQVDTLRVFADVPQNDAAFVGTGTPVYLDTTQYPGRRFTARVTRDAGTINAMSRTLHVEVDVDNRDHALMPGAFAQVHFELRSTHPALDLPVSALLSRPDGMTVAFVDGTGKTQLKRVTVGRDFGTNMEVMSGLNANDRVIDNPSDSIVAGQAVQIVPAGS